jgi:hypothetical protein
MTVQASSPALAGEVRRSRARETGTTVVLVDRHCGGDWIDGDHRWALLCEDHGGLLDIETRALATSWMAQPSGWCSGCQEVVDHE